MATEDELQKIIATDNFYEILGVSRDADDAAIKKAYRKLALRLHPDKCQLESAKQAFQKCSTAFSCLSAPVRVSPCTPARSHRAGQHSEFTADSRCTARKLLEPWLTCRQWTRGVD